MQSQYKTKVEIQKLIKSEAYAKAMQTKGASVAQWNWQAAQSEAGITPPTEEELKELSQGEFDMERELAKVDDELAIEEANMLSANLHHQYCGKELQQLDQASLNDLPKVTPLKDGGSDRQQQYIKTPSTQFTQKKRSVIKNL